jgi:CBS domain-containing protein
MVHLKLRKDDTSHESVMKRIQKMEERIKGLRKVTKPERMPEKSEERKENIEKVLETVEEPEKKIIEPGKDIDEEVVKTIRDGLKDGTIRIDTTVRDVMTTDIKTVKSDDNLRKVMDLLSENKITGAPVVERDKIVGVISEADIIKVMDVRKILDAKKDEIKISELEKIKTKEIMSRDPIVINQKENVTDASELMYKHHVNRLPVVDDKKRLVGIIAKEDVIRGITSEFFKKAIKVDMKSVIGTVIDELINIVEKKESVAILDLSKQLKVDPEQIEEWAKLLEERGMIEIEYSPIGPPKLRKKK